jgi:hypothetical protein
MNLNTYLPRIRQDKTMRSIDAKSTNRTWRMRCSDLCTSVAAIALSVGALSTATPALAQEFVLSAEGDAAFWVTKPQSSHFTPGLYAAVRPGIAVHPVVTLQMSYALLYAPAASGYSEDGTAHFVTVGARVRPLATITPKRDQLGGLFVDANVGYVRTGQLNRFGVDVGVGYNFQVAPWFALGPVVRYAQVVQPNDILGVDENDARVVTVGLNIAFGTVPSEPREQILCAPNETLCPDAPECVQQNASAQTVEPATTCPCPDRDGDTVCDAGDRCPDNFGPTAAFGCPLDPCTGRPLTVLVQFSYDSAGLPRLRAEGPQTMDPALDAVAAAIAQDPSCRVCIMGYASDEGPPEYNEQLSQQRATAVRDYMTQRGLGESRMPTTGFGARCQLVPESTRILNRRVDFLRLQDGESCPTACPE